MSLLSLVRTACRSVGSIAPRVSTEFTINRNIHHICNKRSPSNYSSTSMSNTSPALLQSSTPIYNAVCGLKMKTVLQRRCRHCILMYKNDRAFIKCKAKPRHNQVERKKKEYNTWILTSASQSKRREW